MMRLYPLDPLLGSNDDAEVLAHAAGVTTRTIYRWAAQGVDEWKADTLAIAAGHHPALIWPEWGDAAA